ncbi:hypothetical protein BD413DRAFT_486820 [Trametes elegans]|nr:hypothetical protein BD413DRAFT_486820 [Trametes elegans]
MIDGIDLRHTGLFYYDYLLTLSSEVEIIWRSKWSLSTMFYTCIRYETFLVATLGLLHNFRLTPTSGPQQTVAR